MKTINLDALDTTRAKIQWKGKEYAVQQATARVANMIAAADGETGIAKVMLWYDAVALLIPSMNREDVNELAEDHLLAIIDAAGSAVEAVNEAAGVPKAESPAPETTSGQPAAI